MYFDTAGFLFVENHKNTFLKLWYVTNIFTGTADFVNSLDFYGLKWYYNITQWRQNGAVRQFLRLGGRYFLRGDRQDQQKKLSDEQLVLAGIEPGMVRFSVGLENVDDIIEDIEQPLANI